MLELLTYSSEIRNHITLAGSSLCEDDVKRKYGRTPDAREPIAEISLDPGGFAFTDTDPIVFEVNGIRVSVKPEHLYALDNISTRVLTPHEDWVKIYFEYACVVLPVQTWSEIFAIGKALDRVHMDGRDLLAERLMEP
jgi:hypothetical protein